MNLEVIGIVGKVEVKPDKKTGLPSMHVQFLTDKGRTVKAKVDLVDEKITSLRFGAQTEVRFDEVSLWSLEYGNLSFGAESARILSSSAPVKAVNS